MTTARYPDSLRILAELRRRSEADFAELLQARRVNARGVGDLLDLAEALESPQSIRDALRRLPWPVIRDLRRGTPEALAAAGRLLLALPTQDASLELLPEAAAALDELYPVPFEFTAKVGDSAGAPAAHEIGVMVADALWLLDEAPRPVRSGRDGVRMSGVELRRLSGELQCEPGLAASLYRWLFAAHLMAPAGDAWRPTERGRATIRESVVDRWKQLVSAWLGELRLDEVAQLAAELGVVDANALPNVGTDPDASDAPTLATSAINLSATEFARAEEAEALGVLERGALTPAGALALGGEVDAAAALLAPAFPSEVTQVYLQPDQTVIAPGPLSGELDARLREVAHLERRAMASEYRITPASLEHALAMGRTEAEIEAFLAEVSLTGLPQPVAYLVANTAARFGSIRVTPAPASSRAATLITSSDLAALDAVRVDTNLRSLGLRPSSQLSAAGKDEAALSTAALESQVSPASVVLALHEARYPAILVDREGRTVPSVPLISAEPYEAPIGQTVAATASELAAQAAEPVSDDDRSTWLRRRLELARRAKSPVRVTVETPTGDTQLVLIPTAVSPQRLRARDVEADVERTLPVKSIVALEEVDDGNVDAT